MTELIKITKATNTHFEKKKQGGIPKWRNFSLWTLPLPGNFSLNVFFFLKYRDFYFLPVCYTNNSLTQQCKNSWYLIKGIITHIINHGRETLEVLTYCEFAEICQSLF